MAAYRFVGQSGEIYDTKFSFRQYGQLVDIPEDLAAASITAGFPLITDQEFKDLAGHTEDEIRKWGKRIGHPTVPAEVAAGRDKVWAVLSGRHVAMQEAKAAERAKADAEPDATPVHMPPSDATPAPQKLFPVEVGL